MSPFGPIEPMPVVLALALALTLTPAVGALARHRGLVARPRSDRWHKRPTALFGGVAIFGAVLVPWLVFVPHTTKSVVVGVASAWLWVVGLVDDQFQIKPYQKLIGQVMGAAAVVACGLTLPWTPAPVINMALTVFWLVGITNAVNLLDNMDGLAAGVSAIAAGFLAACFVGNGQSSEALLPALLAAALLGFLVYNSYPASIFMGDCGSLFIGFFLAGTALLHVGGARSRSLLAVLAVPVLILFIPIFDTTFVTVMRKLAGRAVSQGGRDHTSHRLVALGLSERRAVWMLYSFAALSGGLALLVRSWPFDLSMAAILGFMVLLTLLGVHLAGVRAYDEGRDGQAGRGRPLVAFLVNLTYKRRVFEVLLDVVLVLLAYYASCAMLFGPVSDGEPWAGLLRALPVLLLMKMGIFLVAGVYRGLWRYVSIDSTIVYARAVLVSSVTGALVVRLVFGPEGFTPVVFVLDGLILMMLLGGSRITFRLLRQWLPAGPAGVGRRVLIYGAGDAGELLLREMWNNSRLGCVPVGFADDDPLKQGKVIHGMQVFGGNGSLPEICQEKGIEAVYLSSDRISEERAQEVLAECRASGVEVKRMRIVFEPVSTTPQP
jgi:UDP-GlcNAc:undecaprenyl-phosphate GlcNAc-1-phosphate transferase